MLTLRQRDSPRAAYRRRKKDIDIWKNIMSETLLFKPGAVLKLNPDIKRRTFYRRLKQTKKQREISGNALVVPTLITTYICIHELFLEVIQISLFVPVMAG